MQNAQEAQAGLQPQLAAQDEQQQEAARGQAHCGGVWHQVPGTGHRVGGPLQS